jgi:hypothetical protein
MIQRPDFLLPRPRALTSGWRRISDRVYFLLPHHAALPENLVEEHGIIIALDLQPCPSAVRLTQEGSVPP